MWSVRRRSSSESSGSRHNIAWFELELLFIGRRAFATDPDFGPLVPTPGSPHIVSRNLTPDKTGLPEGGRPFSEFLQILKTGVDLDHLHPTCSSTVTTNCLPPPFDGNLLQIMPWHTFTKMTDHDILAIYEYLSAIPCIEGPPAPSVLHNDCH